jgi:spore germination cell wall hydrolase CwlJ-like protein
LTAKLIYDQDDLDSLALCAYKEARGEGPNGMRAVMHVIYHRALAWYGAGEGSVHEAVYAKNQFTSMSVPSDPEFNLQIPTFDANYEFCQRMAPQILSDQDKDETGNALYYANLHEVTSGWFIDAIVNDPAQHPQTAVIGRQTFFK